ncbi:MAG: cell division protein FtsZ [Candidatus Helarchaeota archaeon]
MQSIINSILKEERNKKEALNQPTFSNTMNLNVENEIESYLVRSIPKIRVIGVGGAGNNAINRLNQVGIIGAETIAVNTDAQDLVYTDADVKLLIGKKLTGGLGAGNRPQVGEAAAIESMEEIKKIVNADMVFITCGQGGGTGTGAAHVIAEQARELGALTISICSLPFNVEGPKKKQNAAWGLERLSKASDTIITIPNEKLLEIAPDLSISEAFRIVDEILIQGVKGIAEVITKPGLINLDFADVKTILKNSGESLIGLGEADTVEEATRIALSNPLLDLDIQEARGALINICGTGTSLKLQETENIIRMVTDELNKDAEVIWGTLIDPNMEKKFRITLIVSGIKSNVDQSAEISIQQPRFPDFGLRQL